MTKPVQLFDLAAQQARWLAARQTAVAGNIANANTPGYTSVDVAPFEQVLNSQRVAVSGTAPGHVSLGPTRNGFDLRGGGTAELLPSGNSVVMENELIKANEVRRTFELNTAIVKAFHRMIMLNAKV